MEEGSRYRITFDATYYIFNYVACQQKWIKNKKTGSPSSLLVSRL